jgi:hypothetical protein
MRQLNDNIIPLQASATITTAAVNAAYLISMSAQLTATSGAAGTLKVQASNDEPVAANVTPANWSDLTGASVVVSGAGAFLIPKTDLCYQWIRLVYTNTGSGNISVILKALGQ